MAVESYLFPQERLHWYGRTQKQCDPAHHGLGKLLGSSDGKQYHAVEAIPLSGDTTLNDANWALLFAVDAKNVSLRVPERSMARGSSSIRLFAAHPRQAD
jgi:hypothetical protein